MQIITKNIEKADFSKLAEALPIVFTLAKIIETEDQSQDKDINDNNINHDQYFEKTLPFGREFNRTEDRKTWEGTLKEGMIIDCLKSACKDVRKIWSKAKIIGITKSENNSEFI